MAELCADVALEAHAGSCTESAVIDYLMNFPERARRRLLTHGHIAISRALEFNKEPNGFVKALLDQPEIQVNSVDLDGITLLLRAIVTRNKEVVRMLLARPDLDPNVGNVTTRNAPLHFASQPGSSLEILGMLLSDRRVIVAVLNRDEQSSLHAAVMLKNRRSDAARVSDVILLLVNSAKEKLKSVPDFLQKTDVHGRNVLHYAAESGLGDAVSELRKLDHTLALVYDNEGLQPVHLATQRGHLQVVKLLLPDGRGCADDFVQECLQAKRRCSLDPEHCSMLHLAQELLAITRHRYIADFLLREFNVYTSRIEVEESPSLFHWAVTVHDSGGHGARLIPHILKWQPGKANAPLGDVKHQRTALIVSAIAGNLEVVEALCRANGQWQLDGTWRDYENKAALDYGFEENHVDVCRILRKRSDVKDDLANKHRKRDAYAIAAHAVLVVSILVVTLTYTHCLTGSEVQKRRAEGTLVTQFRLPSLLLLTKFAFVLSMASTVLAAFAALPFSFGNFFVQTVDDRYVSRSLSRTRVLTVSASTLLMLALGAITFEFLCSQFIAPSIDYQCELACQIALGLFVLIAVTFLLISGVCFRKERREKQAGRTSRKCASDVSEEDHALELQVVWQSGSQQSV